MLCLLFNYNTILKKKANKVKQKKRQFNKLSRLISKDISELY